MPTPKIEAEYFYRDEAGTVLHKKTRYVPKTFRQSRPDLDEPGRWIYDLTDVRKVLYRLPDLKGQKAILMVEGEKDVEAAWAIGVPATCTPDGAGKWLPEYGEQLKAQGVERVAVIPDNDAPGTAHAILVCVGLCAAGIDTRLVTLPGLPDHGDLSDYLQTHTKADLLARVKATEPYVAVAEIASTRRFQQMGEQRYVLTTPNGIVLEANRLRRSSQELHGELLVRVNGQFPDARTFGDGILQVGDMNFSSTTTRTSRSKLLAERAGEKSVDWYGILEEFITEVLAAERRGKPAEPLADAEDEEDDGSEAWLIESFPLLQQLPQIIFGDAASGKSYFAMWLAGKLAEMGIPVLYADWEFSKSEHKKRLQRLFQPMPKNLLYIRCDHPLKQETDHLIDVIQKHRIRYIVCDSIGFAVDGPAESQEGAAGYFRYLRQLKVGSLNIAHIPKQFDDNREATVFGSVFFKAGARSIWFIDRAKENPNGEIRFGLYHRKNNVGALLQPKGFKLVFRGDVTSVEAINLKDVEELAAGFPLLDRMRELLVSGPLNVKSIAEELSTTVANVRGVLSRHRSQFVKVGSKISVSSGRPEDNSEGVAEF